MISHDFDYVRTLVQQRTGIALDGSKESLVESRLEGLVHQQRLRSLDDLMARLRNQPFNGLHVQVVELILTTETSFFRDQHPFETLKNHVLPELLRRRAAERTLNVWSAACSSGQEPYSIAMLLRTYFPDLAKWNVRLIASDISGTILNRARQGRYNQMEVNRGLPAYYLVKYFQKQGSEWQLNDDIRRMVDFRQINLVDDWPLLPAMDVIFLRNVMIYFDVETKKAMLQKAARLLRPDGCLVLGGAETTFNLCDLFRRLSANDRDSYYRLVEQQTKLA